MKHFETQHKSSLRGLLSISALALFLCVGCSPQQTYPIADNEAAENEVSVNDTEDTAGTASEDTAAAISDNSADREQDSDEELIEEEEPLPATVTILGKEYDRNVSFLDLSTCTPKDVAELSDILRDMPELEKVNLMDEEDSSSLSLNEVQLLIDAAPDVKFIYRFDLFGQRLSLSDTVIRYKNAEIGNDGEESIRQALSVLRKCSYFVLDDCGIDDEIMAGIREDFPETKVVWRVHVGNKSALTDDPIIRMTHGIEDSMTGPLKYCTEAVYMDLGHDSGISDISFTANMPALECLILSGSTVTDLSPLKNCTALTWLELTDCGKVNDISDIKDIASIKYLNISYTGVRDISPVMDMELDRLCCIGNYIPRDVQDEYTEAHPDCMTAFNGNPWGYAWRYDDYGYHYFSYYARMCEVFRYEKSSPGGFKYPEYVEPENVIDEDDPPKEP